MKLIAQTGPSAGKEFPLTKEVITIGRGSGNDIVLPDPRVSRQHAEIRRQDDEFIITDLGSTNGTFVNGVRIEEPQPLRRGDRIEIGTTAFLFQTVPSEEVAPAPAIAPPGPPARGRRLAPVFMAAVGAVLFVLAFVGLFALWRPAGEVPTPTEVAIPTQPPVPTPTNTPLPPTPTATLTPTAVPTLTPTPLPDAVVDVYALNVRAGPGTIYDIIGGTQKGDELKVIAKTPRCDWLQVITPKGVEGWVSATYVKLNLDCDDIPVGSIPPTLTPTAVR